MGVPTRFAVSLVLAAATATIAGCGSAATDPAAADRAAVITATPTSPASSPASSPSTVETSQSTTASVPLDGRITIDQLIAHRVTIPAAWPSSMCPTGLQVLHRGSMAKVNHDSNADLLHVYKVVYTNLDTDRSLETAALVTCQFGEAATGQVIAFDRNAAGRIVTKGTIASGVIWSLSARSDGGVTVDISDMEACCSTPKAVELHQTRSYAYRSGRFVQVAGPSTFVPHTQRIDLAIRIDSVTWSARANGRRTGTITVTITNNSTVRSGDLLLIYSNLNEDSTIFRLSGLGSRAHITKTITVSETDDGLEFGSSHAHVHELGSGAVGGDAKPSNNWATVTMW